jgi:hypothetical protein
MAGALAIPLALLAWHRPVAEVLLGAGFALLLLVQHRGNMQRLLMGVEPRGFSRVKD